MYSEKLDHEAEIERLRTEIERLKNAPLSEQLVIKRICEHCNSQYKVPAEETAMGDKLCYTFGICPNCNERDDPWITIERKKDDDKCRHPGGFSSYDPVEDSHYCPHCGVGRG